MAILTNEGFVDENQKAFLKIGGERIEVRDVDIGHPPARSAPVHFEKKPVIKNTPQYHPEWFQSNIQKTKFFVIFFSIIAFFIVFSIGVFWSNGTFSRLADKDFGASVTVEPEGDTINNNVSNYMYSNPNIRNEHTIYNNISLQLPDDYMFDERELENLQENITNEILDELEPMLERIVRNATNST